MDAAEHLDEHEPIEQIADAFAQVLQFEDDIAIHEREFSARAR